MIYKNTPQLRTWLQDAAFNVIAEYEEFTLSEEDYRRQLSKVQRRPVGEREDAAAFRCLTSEKQPERRKDSTPVQILLQQDQLLKSQQAHQSKIDASHGEHENALEKLSRQVEQVETRLNAGLVGMHTKLVEIEGKLHASNANLKTLQETCSRAVTNQAFSRLTKWAAIIAALLLLLSMADLAYGQNTNPTVVVANCGTPPTPYPGAGNRAPATVDANGKLCADVSGATVNVNFLTAAPSVSISNTPTVTVGTFPDNEPFNLAQVNGATVTTGVGTATGAQRVASIQHDGTNVALIDPCQSETASFFNISTTANAQIITGTASKRVYLCSLNVVVAAATNIAIVAGTGSVCASTTVAVPGTSGGATAATGWNFSANGGIALGNGTSSFAQTTVNGDNVCIFLSAANQTSGGGKYVVR